MRSRVLLAFCFVAAITAASLSDRTHNKKGRRSHAHHRSKSHRDGFWTAIPTLSPEQCAAFREFDDDPRGRGAFASAYAAETLEHQRVIVKDFSKPGQLMSDDVEGQSRKESFDELRKATWLVAADNSPLCPSVVVPMGQCPRQRQIVYPDVGITLQKLTKPMDMCTGLALLHQLASALECLDTHRFVHCDIKPDNVAINRHTGVVTLIDVGSITRRARGHACDQMSPFYSDKYVLRNPPLPASTANDMFSLGMVGFFAMFRTLPLPAKALRENPRAYAGRMIEHVMTYANLADTTQEDVFGRHTMLNINKFHDEDYTPVHAPLLSMIDTGAHWATVRPTPAALKTQLNGIAEVYCGFTLTPEYLNGLIQMHMEENE